MPSLAAWFTSAFSASSVVTSSMWPLWQAMCSGVEPSSFLAWFTSTPTEIIAPTSDGVTRSSCSSSSASSSSVHSSGSKGDGKGTEKGQRGLSYYCYRYSSTSTIKYSSRVPYYLMGSRRASPCCK